MLGSTTRIAIPLLGSAVKRGFIGQLLIREVSQDAGDRPGPLLLHACELTNHERLALEFLRSCPTLRQNAFNSFVAGMHVSTQERVHFFLGDLTKNNFVLINMEEKSTGRT